MNKHVSTYSYFCFVFYIIKYIIFSVTVGIHHVGPWLQIDWQDEHFSTAAHVVGLTWRTAGNAWRVRRALTKMSKSPTIAIMSHILGYSSHRRVRYDSFGEGGNVRRDFLSGEERAKPDMLCTP